MNDVQLKFKLKFKMSAIFFYFFIHKWLERIADDRFMSKPRVFKSGQNNDSVVVEVICCSDWKY